MITRKVYWGHVVSIGIKQTVVDLCELVVLDIYILLGIEFLH